MLIYIYIYNVKRVIKKLFSCIKSQMPFEIQGNSFVTSLGEICEIISHKSGILQSAKVLKLSDRVT